MLRDRRGLNNPKRHCRKDTRFIFVVIPVDGSLSKEVRGKSDYHNSEEQQERSMRHNISRLALISIGLMIATAIVMTAPTSATGSDSHQPQPSSTATSPVSIDLDELEDHPEKFIGKTVTVEGEVDRVLGPNLFTIDERDWVDAEREMPVVVPDPFSAIVHSDAPVRVTGTVQKVPIAQIERRGGILTDPKIKAEIETKPALVATAVSTLAPVAVNLLVRPETPAGTSEKSAGAPVTDASQVARSSDKSLVGKRANLSGAKVAGTSARGFWIVTPDGERVFVMPGSKTSVKEGQAADIQGVVLELPEGLKVELKAPGESIYIYADKVAAR
jgi:hypothetical protein